VSDSLPETAPISQEAVRGRIEDWRRRLIDLSYRNRLINYRPTRATTIEIETPELETLLADPSSATPWGFYFPPEEDEEEVDEAESEAAAIVDQLVIRAAHAARSPRADEIVARGELNARRISRILDNLAKKSNAEFQDKALRILYLAAGFLDWVDPARDESLSSPLILVPVELRRETARHPYRLYFVDDEEIVINPSLTEKLRRDVKLELPEDWAWEDKPVEQELDEIAEAIGSSGWSVRRDAAIGLFSFQKYVMYRDLLDNEDTIAAHPVVASLAEGKLVGELGASEGEIPALEQLDEVQPPETDFSILDADATQRRCLEVARRGQSFVMQGPPGTGKSQTIANLIADAVARGKRVLFVSEKAAALDVVHKRLAREGLDEFCLLLHGEHAARREVVLALDRSLTGDPVPRPGMSSHELERLEQLRELLNNTAEVVHLPLSRLGDRSLRDVLGQLAQLHRAPAAPGAPPSSEANGAAVRREFQQLNDIFQGLAERWRVSSSGFVWSGYAPDRFSSDERSRVLTIVETLAQAVASLEQDSAGTARSLGWASPADAQAVDGLLELGGHLLSAPQLEEGWLDRGAGTRLREAAGAAQPTFERRLAAGAALESAYVDFESVPADLPDRLRVQLENLAELAGRTAHWEDELLAELPTIRRLLARIPTVLAEGETAAAEAGQILGQPEELASLARIEQVARLANLAFKTEQRPEAAWLVSAGRDRARTVLAELRPLAERYHEERAALLEHYRQDALSLQADELLNRFQHEHTGALAKLKSSYRSDAKTIKAVRRDQKLPKTVVEDLISLSTLQGLEQQIAALEDSAHRALGVYARGWETDFDRTERALAVAVEAAGLAGSHSNLELLAGQLCVDSSPSPRIAQLADQLDSATQEAREGFAQLSRFVGKLGTPERATLLELQTLLDRLRQAFENFGEVVDEFDRGAKPVAGTLETLDQRAEALSALHQARAEIARNSSEWNSVLGNRFNAEATDWEAVGELADWLVRLEELSNGPLPEELRSLLLQQERRWPDFAALQASSRQFTTAAASLAELFGDGATEAASRSAQTSFDALRERCDSLRRDVDQLHDWIEYKEHCRRAAERGWDRFVAALAEHNVEPAEVVAAFQRAFWNRRLEAAFEDDPDLADRGSSYARWIEEFRQLDRRLIRTAADRLIAARNSARRAHIALPGGQMALLRKEAAKRRRHMPVRVLLARISELVSDLKPCLMMSPLTVSHFLSPSSQFDLVVFDEASQVPPQDAINCIYRGKQLIVAGDTRQLPPTPFFQVAEAEESWSEEAGDQSEDMESILDSCEALLERHPLQWHYRSRHEDLIDFSNEHVYDRLLRTFPSADPASPQKGVRFVHVADGLYERGRAAVNRPEARAVAERVLAHLERGKSSVGVIAFSVSQANAIGEELDRIRVLHPQFEEHFSADRLEGVFVKHLESVQGDERDVILFSVGYGRDREGKFSMNFGPLNKEGGIRRLNVAITRARELVEVVSSVRSSDFTLSESASRGARMLRDYIRYAEAGGNEHLVQETEEPDYDSSLEAAVAQAVAELGLAPIPRVGVGSFRIDIGIRDERQPEHFLLGIETDGESYRSTPTARDRDRLREEVLTNLGWRIHRIWSLDWVRDRQGELGRLAQALEQARTAAAVESPPEREDEPPPREREERIVEDVRGALEAGHLPWVVPYQRLELPRQSGIYEFHESVNRDKQRDLVVQLLEAEAPIHVDYAISRLAQAWGLKRAGHRVQQAGRTAVNMAVRSGKAEQRGDFLWRPGQELEVVREPDWDDHRTFRDISFIPPEEIDLTFAKLIEASGGEIGDHLIPEVARVLGFDRVGQNIRSILSSRLLRGNFGVGSDSDGA
jgi:polyhydroxyalkanoate synthesis regulator phasin